MFFYAGLFGFLVFGCRAQTAWCIVVVAVIVIADVKVETEKPENRGIERCAPSQQ